MKYVLMMLLALMVATDLYSQTELKDEFLKNNIYDPFLIHGKGTDKIVFEKESFKNHSNQILKTTTFDSTSVVDSLIVTQVNGERTKAIYTYNSNGLRILGLWKYWVGEQWVVYKRERYSYDSNGNLTLLLDEDLWDSQWKTVFRFRYTYNSNRNLTLEIWDEWAVDRWFNILRESYIYDSNGKRTLYLIEGGNDSQWVNEYRCSYTYDSNGNMTLELNESWDGSQWVNGGRWTYTYNSNGNNSLKLWQEWGDGQWVNYRQESYNYDSNGNRTLELWQKWDGGHWVNITQINYSYDSNQNMTLKLWQEWNGGQWVDNWRERHSYDSNGNRTLFLYDQWNGIDSWNIRNGSLSFYDSFGNYFWLEGTKINLSYNTTTDILKHNFNDFNFSLSQNYPNPFNPSTKIEYRIPNSEHGIQNVELKVYDMLGREVATLVNKEQTAGRYEVQFDASNLTSGIYFYQLRAMPSGGQTGGFAESRKMVLLR